jgi:hypothetical protein
MDTNNFKVGETYYTGSKNKFGYFIRIITKIEKNCVWAIEYEINDNGIRIYPAPETLLKRSGTMIIDDTKLVPIKYDDKLDIIKTIFNS